MVGAVGATDHLTRNADFVICHEAVPSNCTINRTVSGNAAWPIPDISSDDIKVGILSPRYRERSPASSSVKGAMEAPAGRSVRFVVSLKTQSLGEAQDRRWPLVKQWRETFQRAQTGGAVVACRN